MCWCETPIVWKCCGVALTKLLPTLPLGFAVQTLFLEMRRDDCHIKPKFCAKVLKELGAYAEDMGRRGAGEKEKISYFRAVTEFLLTFSPQHFGLAKGLCKSLHNLVKDSWGRTGIDALKRSRGCCFHPIEHPCRHGRASSRIVQTHASCTLHVERAPWNAILIESHVWKAAAWVHFGASRWTDPLTMQPPPFPLLLFLRPAQSWTTSSSS